MPLSNPRFIGEPKLEECLAGTRTLTLGASGSHVKKVQQALLDLKFKLPVFGADGQYGSETATAVFEFKRSKDLRNAAGRIDGIVGPKTMDRLDKDAPKSGGGGGGGGSTIDADHRLINLADGGRLAALMKCESELQRIIAKFGRKAPDPEERVVKALRRQLFVSLDIDEFWPTVDTFLSFTRTNRLTNRVPFHVDKAAPEFAHVDESNDPGKGITFCASFFNTNGQCRQEVITHEYFHFVVGLGHFYDAAKLVEAMRCPHHLAEAVFDVALGHVSGCGGHGMCLD